MMIQRPYRPGFALLELLLAIALLILVCQLVPSLWAGMLWALDVRNWSQAVWFAVNCGVLLTLAAIRFGPDVWGKLRKRRKQAAREGRRWWRRRVAAETAPSLDTDSNYKGARSP